MAGDVCRNSPLSLQCRACARPTAKRGRMHSEYCSEECRLEYKRAHRGKRPAPICEVCGEPFPRKSGRQKFCETCRDAARREYSRRYFCENADRIRPEKRAYALKRRQTDAEHVRRLDRAWKAKNWEQILADRRTPEERAKAARWQRLRAAKIPSIAISRRMHAGIAQSLKAGKAGRQWESLVDYTLPDLCRHLERQFLPGMSWENRNRWHIDHIVPLASFKFDTADCDEFRAAWALTNLRPLWKRHNLSKGGRRVHLL